MDQVRTSPRTTIIALLAAIALTVATWLAMTGLPGAGGSQASVNWNKAPRTVASVNWNKAPIVIASVNWNSAPSVVSSVNWN